MQAVMPIETERDSSNKIAERTLSKNLIMQFDCSESEAGAIETLRRVSQIPARQ